LLEIDGNLRLQAKRTIIATGSRPSVPENDENWELGREDFLTSDEIFELDSLPASLAVVGMGPIGLELGQAFSRLGVKVHGFTASQWIGGSHDPELNQRALKFFADEFPLHTEAAPHVRKNGGKFQLEWKGKKITVEKVLVAAGRKPNLKDLGLENLKLPLQEDGVPRFDPGTMQIEGFPIFLAGDVSSYRPILHEAIDEGRIAGYNSVRATSTCFLRRAPLRITFTDPNLAAVGEPFDSLDPSTLVTGEAALERQGRATIMARNYGLIRVFLDKNTGELKGAELMAPEAEHLAHLLAWALQREMTAAEILQMPYYHPTLEESLRTALRSAAKKLNRPHSELELSLCGESGIEALS
jgi:dihydrolipoamide dehydrogenase